MAPLQALVACAAAACAPPHDNPYDPRNAEGRRPRAVLAELFVVDPAAAAPVRTAIEAVERLLAEEFRPGTVVLLRYHLPSRTFPDDPLALEAAGPRYERYVEEPERRGVPDLFVNGAATRVTGATEATRTRNRYRAAFEEARAAASAVAIETWLVPAQDAAGLRVGARVAALGSADALDLEIQFALLVDRGPGGMGVVRALPPAQPLPLVPGGEVIEVASDPVTLPLDADVGGVYPVAFVLERYGQHPAVLQTTRGDAL